MMPLATSGQIVECFVIFFFQAEDGIRDVERSRGLGDVLRDRTTRVSEDSCNTLVYIINKSKKKQKAARKLHS